MQNCMVSPQMPCEKVVPLITYVILEQSMVQGVHSQTSEAGRLRASKQDPRHLLLAAISWTTHFTVPLGAQPSFLQKLTRILLVTLV